MLRPTNPVFRLLSYKANMSFGSFVKESKKALDQTIHKARRKQSVTDVKKLQSYLGEAGVNKTFNSAVNRTAQYDKEFNEFFKDYKEKNKEFANIIDLSHYANSQNVAKTEEMRKEELMMFEEFRRRRQEKTFDMKSDDEEIDSAEESENESDTEARTNPENTKERFSKISMTRDADRAIDEVLEEKMRRYYGDEKFIMLLMDRGVTTNVTTLNRVNHFRYLVFMGNMNGVIGYGKGKGGDFQTALKNAIHDCKKNLVAFPLDHFYSLTAPIKVHYNGMKLELDPRRWMNAWGSPTMAYMLMLAGVTHCSFKITSRNPDPYMLCYTLMKALTKARTPTDLSEMIGTKIYHNNYSSWQYSNVRSEVIPNTGPSYR